MSKVATTNVDDALDRLNGLLPLKPRQSHLVPAARELHRTILQSFADSGHPPTRAELSRRFGESETEATSTRLDDDDLIVLSSDKREIRGAYPFTMDETPHEVEINGNLVHAMCAVDALAMAPMFETETTIHSRGHTSSAPVVIRMRDREALEASPESVNVGIRWQSTSGCAASSLCTEMVFLENDQTALQWQARDPDGISLLTLGDAIDLGAAFFKPLLSPE